MRQPIPFNRLWLLAPALLSGFVSTVWLLNGRGQAAHPPTATISALQGGTTLSCGSLLVNTISASGEVDQITFNGLVGERKTLTLTAGGFPNFVTARATVFSPTVELITFDANTQRQLTLPESGTYIIQIRASNLTSTGNYSIGLECLLPTSPVDATLTCGALLSSRPISASGQVDQITFDGQANHRVTLTLTAGGFPNFVTATATVFSPTLAVVGTFNANTQQQLTLPESGTYIIQVYASNLVSAGSYSLGLECLLPTSPVDATLTCGTLLSNRPINASGQVDQITFSGQATERKTLTLTAGGFPNFVTATATVFSPTLAVVGTFNANTQQQLMLTESGTYIIQVYASNLVSTGNYSLGLECLLPTSPVDAILVCGSLFASSIAASGEVDQITFSGQANQRVTLTLTAGGFPNFVTATATVFSPTAAVVVTFDANNQQQLALPESGTYIIQVYANNLVSAGAYSLGLECLLPTSPVDGILACGTLLSNRPIGASGQVDQITFSGQATERKTLTLTAGGFPNFVTATATVFSPTLAVVATFNANNQQQLTLTESGTYIIQVYASNLVSTGNYSLGLSCLLSVGITVAGRVADAGNASVSNATVTLSGVASRVAVTDNNGIYAFENLAPGNYAVIPSSPYFAFTPPRADFPNLSSNQVQNFAAVSNVVPTPTPPLMDEFPPSPVPNPDLWNLGVLTQPPGSFDPLVTASQTTGQLVITPRANQSGNRFNGYVTLNNYDFSNGQVAVELVQAGANGSQSLFSMGTDSANFARFLALSPLPGATLTVQEVLNGEKQAPFETTMTMLMFQIVFNGQVFLNVSIPYDPIAHRFLRFRHFAPANQIIFETSPDTAVWTERARGDLGERTVTGITVELGGGTAGVAGAPGPIVFDNLVTQVVNARFAAAGVTVNEGDGVVNVTVQRTGLTNLTSSVEYLTLDGTASQRSRYVTSTGVLNFAAGETAKTVSVIIVDDGLVQGAQTFSIILANGFGMGVNGPGRVVVTINDNDTPPVTTNPIDDARFFVRAQYFDFLNRVPDQSGEDFWTNQITGVCAPTDAMCINRRRVEVSAAFYIELEFQKTGAYVYRLYRAAFGNNQPFPNPEPHPDAPALLNYAVFTPDRARINADAALLTQSLRDLAANFVNRPAFRTRYPATQTGEQFVDALIATVQTASGVSLVSQRATLLAEFNVGGRARVIYRLAEDSAQNPVDNRAFINAEFNRAFVLMQYFGYLRRDPDLAGFNFWLGLLNQQPSNARGMVCAFTTSQEYQQRFSLVFTRTNQLCGSLFP